MGDNSVVIRLAVVSQICKITRNSERIRTYSSSRSSKVMMSIESAYLRLKLENGYFPTLPVFV